MTRKCHICGSTPAEGHDWREGQGGQPLCSTCAEGVGKDKDYGPRKKR